MENPLKQFTLETIVPLCFNGHDLSLTNSALFMVVTVFVVVFFLSIASSKKALIPNRLQMSGEILYGFVSSLLRENAGEDAKPYFPFVFSLFLFILFGNLIGLIPHAYSFTSQLIVTFGLALSVFILITCVGFLKHGVKFLGFFLPSGTPLLLAPFLMVIEILSYLSRPISLSVRLFANMLAGHIMLVIFASFVVLLLSLNSLLSAFGIAPFLFTMILIGFEFMVSCLQAYVFTILTCLYIHDVIHLH